MNGRLPGRGVRGRSGFTLMEFVAVLAILAFATAIAVPAFRSWYAEDDLTEATHRIEALFRVARDSAVRSGVPVTVVIDSVSSMVWFDVPEAAALVDEYADRDLLTPSDRSLTQGVTTWRTAGGAADHVVPGESLDLPPTVSLEVARARARFEFAPSGAAFADTLVLRWSMGERLITLNRWTGDVLVF